MAANFRQENQNGNLIDQDLKVLKECLKDYGIDEKEYIDFDPALFENEFNIFIFKRDPQFSFKIKPLKGTKKGSFVIECNPFFPGQHPDVKKEYGFFKTESQLNVCGYFELWCTFIHDKIKNLGLPILPIQVDKKKISFNFQPFFEKSGRLFFRFWKLLIAIGFFTIAGPIVFTYYKDYKSTPRLEVKGIYVSKMQPHILKDLHDSEIDEDIESGN